MWNESFAEWRGGNIMLQMWQGYALNHTCDWNRKAAVVAISMVQHGRNGPAPELISFGSNTVF
jgi:hypothetical protein